MTAIAKALPQEKLTTGEALALFDELETVDIDSMLGRWQGAGLQTGHRLDGLLEACHWYGKEFLDADRVHPLLFTDQQGHLFKVNPRLMPMGLATRVAVPRTILAGRLFLMLKPLLRTATSRARLRMTEYRGKLSATMIYDDLPINDVFRKVDQNTLLGVMDLKGVEQPFFFILRRDAGILPGTEGQGRGAEVRLSHG